MSSSIKDNKLKIAIVGSVDAGKSSIIGVLSSGELDDGRGSARKKITRLKHELVSGRTSNVSFNYIKYEKRKIVTLIDLCGHEKYLKTTLFGLTGVFPDAAMVIIGANMGISKMTEEHLSILIYLKIPFITVITKVDMCPKPILEQTQSKFIGMMSKKKVNKKAIEIDEKNIDNYAELLCKDDTNIAPYILVSNLTGYNIDVLKKFIDKMTPRVHWKKEIKTQETIFYIDDIYHVRGIGIVISGIVRGSPILIGQKMYIGPVSGEWIEFRVKSIHANIKENIDMLEHGQTGCIACGFIKKDEFKKHNYKKGMVAVTSNDKLNVCTNFIAEILVLNHSTKIEDKYEPVIHCGPIRQTAKVIIEDKTKKLGIGDKANVELQFKQRPEFLEEGTTLFFREGLTKGIGTVIKLLPMNLTIEDTKKDISVKVI